MKLIIVTAIKEFEKEIKQILSKSNINSFNYGNVSGYRDSSNDAVKENWFASEMNEVGSIIFHVIATKEKADKVFEIIEIFNEKQKTISKIHISIIELEKSN